MEEKGTKKERIQSIIIAVLSLIIVFGVAFFASELKYCDVKEEIQLEEIGMNEFITLLNDESSSIIYIARPGCGYCQQQEPIMKAVVNEYNLTVHYLNTDNLTNENMSYIFKLDEKLFGENGKNFGTPTTLIVKKGEIVDSVIGLTQNKDLVTFFKENGFIK